MIEMLMGTEFRSNGFRLGWTSSFGINPVNGDGIPPLHISSMQKLCSV